MKKLFIIFTAIFFFLFFLTDCQKNDKENNLQTDTLTENSSHKDTTLSIELVDIDTITDDTTTGKTSSTVLQDKDYTAKYICPNHCEGSGSDKPGTCPVCGMELIENPNYQGNQID